MGGWRGDDEKNVRRMRKILEQKRKEKRTKRRVHLYGEEPEDSEGDEDTFIGSNYPSNWEEGINSEVQRTQEEVKEN